MLENQQTTNLRTTGISRRRFLQYTGGAILGAAAAGAVGWTYISKFEPQWVEIVHLPIKLPGISPDFNGFRLAQISDIHIGKSGLTGEQLAVVCSQILAQKPDLVAMTGDFVDRKHGLAEALGNLTDALRLLTDQVQVVAVLGNHDYWTGPGEVRKMFNAAGILDLSNKVLPVERNGSRLFIAGVDDVWERQDRLDDVLAQIPENQKAAVLLAHEPDFADTSAVSDRIALQISGHTHGGQVNVPFIGPPVLPRYGEKYPVGLYQVGNMLQYTNRGLGTIAPHVRFNCRPEVTLFTFEA